MYYRGNLGVGTGNASHEFNTFKAAGAAPRVFTQPGGQESTGLAGPGHDSNTLKTRALLSASSLNSGIGTGIAGCKPPLEHACRT